MKGKEGDVHLFPEGPKEKGERPLLFLLHLMFDAGFYQRYYVDPRTRVASRADALRLGRFVCAYTAYLGFTVKRVLDAGCGLGHLRQPVREFFPRARYVGLETSEYLCRRYGWIRESVADYEPRTPFDLVLCHDVLQYLDDRTAVRALVNLGKLSRGALYFSVLTARTGGAMRIASEPIPACACARPPGTRRAS